MEVIIFIIQEKNMCEINLIFLGIIVYVDISLYNNSENKFGITN